MTRTNLLRGLLVVALALALPGLSAAQQCLTTVSDLDKNGQKDIKIMGTTGPEKLTVNIYQTQTVMTLACAYPGGYNNKVFPGSFGMYEFRLKGKDNIFVNLAEDIVGQSLNIQVQTGGGGKVTFGGPGALKGGSKLVLGVSGGFGDDTIALNVPNVDASELYLKTDLQDGNNGVIVINNNSITNGGRVFVNGNIVGLYSTYKFVNTGLVDGTLDVNLEGGSISGPHPDAKDIGTAYFGGQVGPNGRLFLKTFLNSGADVFNGTFDLSTLAIAAGGELHIDVNGGLGNDTINLGRDTAKGGTGTVAGLLDINLSGGDGDDHVYADLGGGGFRTDGTIRLRLDGGIGNDTVQAALTVDAASLTPMLDVFLFGGQGSDTMNLNLVNNGPNTAANYLGGMAIVDGGVLPGDTCTQNGNGIIHLRNCP